MFAISVVPPLLGIGAFAFVAGGLGLDLSFATVAWTRSAAVLIATLPVSVAGLGVREGAMVVLLAPYGVCPTRMPSPIRCWPSRPPSWPWA